MNQEKPVEDIAPPNKTVITWDEPEPEIYGKRTATIVEGRLWIETAHDTLSIGIPEGWEIRQREP